MKKKQIALLLAAAMAVMSFTGCGQEQTSNQNQESSTVSSETAGSADSTEAVEEIKNFNAEGYPIVDEKITLKVLLGIRDSDNMMAPDDMPAVQRLEELTGIDLEWEVVKATDWNTKLNLMFASGEYPDVILSVQNKVDYEEYGVTQKILVPLDELIDTYLPSYTERIAMSEADPTINLVASDGQTYTVGYMNDTGAILENQFFINQDWLDALNLPMPTDVESLTETLRAFKTKDPNGNGQADEIPLTTRLAEDIYYSVPAYVSMFGVPAHNGNWLYIDNNKEVQLVPEQDGFRECMEWFHMLYKEGLVDMELFSQDKNTLITKVKTGLAGVTSCYNPTSNFGLEISEKLSLFVPDENTVMHKGYAFAQAAAYITVANEHPEATMRLFEAMLDKETQWNMYWGEADEGDGNGWKYNDAGLIETWVNEGYQSPTVKNNLGVCSMFFAPGAYYADSYVVAENMVKKLAFEAEYINKGLLQEYSYKLLDLVKLTPEQNEQRSLTETEINNAVLENMSSFIKDGVTDDSWNAFLNVLKNMKADEYKKMYQDGIDTLDLN